MSYVGPALAASAGEWSGVDGRPLVVVTLGTANAAAGVRFLAESVDALAGMPSVRGLVVAPIRDDQSMLAQQVVAASAGVRLRFDRAKAADIREAIESAGQYRLGAEKIRDSFEAAGGAEEAATRLESLG
ncbi:glycosyl transferase [Amycolatopsis mediterranei]|uniref:Glycosyl transferase n=1 Tax=Amycolatopsis mediterranei (strain S699) TaxID=713604 RepID=A0A9R0P4M5_AMYMS|nr:glycosyl transferase [Amycolatopsis mediterranei]AEK46302.1 glycosyl transferase [Amycolatopsis mediterranei S699]UZF74349.1 glycosyl transferase [Amycolatopsis mediterranei]